MRFKIEIHERAEYWHADVYDHEDHGPDLLYASVTAGSLATVLDHVRAYVLAAEVLDDGS